MTHFTDTAAEHRLADVLQSVSDDITRRIRVADVRCSKALLSPDVPMSDRISRLENLCARLHGGSVDDFEKLVVQSVAALMCVYEARECRLAALADNGSAA